MMGFVHLVALAILVAILVREVGAADSNAGGAGTAAHRMCTAFEPQVGVWSVDPDAAARGETTHAALHSELFRNKTYDYAYRSVPYRDFADCPEPYKWQFQPNKGTCHVPLWEEQRLQFLQQLSGKTVVFAGDSLVRQLYTGMRNKLIMDSSIARGDDRLEVVSVGRWHPACYPKWTAGKTNEAETSQFRSSFGTIRLRFFPVYSELYYAHSFAGNSSWLDTADVLIVNVGAFAHAKEPLEVALQKWVESLEAYIARRTRPPLRVIWKEYTPAHFPALVRPPADAPGEPIWPIPQEMHQKIVEDRLECSTAGISLQDARAGQFRLSLLDTVLSDRERRRVESNATRSEPWEVFRLFDAMWERADGHIGLQAKNDCRHWCQFSGTMDFWVGALVNGLALSPASTRGKPPAEVPNLTEGRRTMESPLTEVSHDACPAIAHGLYRIRGSKGHKAPKCQQLSTPVADTYMCVHPPQKDTYISAGIITRGQWTLPCNEAYRINVVCQMVHDVRSIGGGRQVWTLDVGSNIGTFTLPLLAAGVNVISFEADDDNIALINASVTAQRELAARTPGASPPGQWILVPGAVGHSDSHEICFDREVENNRGSGRIDQTGRGRCRKKMRTHTIDTALKQHGLMLKASELIFAGMKLDVQDAEPLAIEGSQHVLRSNPPLRIFYEGNNQTLVKQLANVYGYATEKVYHDRCNGNVDLVHPKTAERIRAGTSATSVRARPAARNARLPDPPTRRRISCMLAFTLEPLPRSFEPRLQWKYGMKSDAPPPDAPDERNAPTPVARILSQVVAPKPTVFTFGNSVPPFRELVLNALHNIHRMADPITLVIHCMDETFYAECNGLLLRNFSGMPWRCHRADCCTASQGMYWKSILPKNALNEAIGIYKQRATIQHLKEHDSPVVLMDADAMVLARACFDELFAYDEDMVAQMEGHLACPASAEQSLGFTINTGMIMFRPAMLGVLELLVELRDNATCVQPGPWKSHEESRTSCPGSHVGYRYRAHCSDQEILNTIVRGSHPRWTTYGSVLQFTPARAWATPRLMSSKRDLSVRMLDANRWRFAFSTSQNVSAKFHKLRVRTVGEADARMDVRYFPFPRGPQGPGVCLAHAAGLNSQAKIPIMRNRGVWYLPEDR